MDDKSKNPEVGTLMRRIYDDVDNLQDSLQSLEGLRDLFMFNRDVAPKALATGGLLELIHADYQSKLAEIKSQVEDVLSKMK